MATIDKPQITVSEQKHVLLVSPLTFSYHITIAETLSAMGYKVTWWNDRVTEATWYKLLLRFFPKTIALLSEYHFKKIIKTLDSKAISHVLIIKGEGLSAKTVSRIREAYQLASMGLYLWDGAENLKTVHSKLSYFDSIATFDPHDALSFGWTYRPLFWRKVSRSIEKYTPNYDWCFIGTVHSDRHKIIHRLRQQHSKQFKSYVFAYFQSPLVLFMRKLIDFTLWFSPKGTISTNPMPAIEVAKIVAQSYAVLDIEHPKQRGFTMRTIETLMAEKKLITTNKHIFDSNLFHPSRVLIIDRQNPIIASEFFNESFVKIPEQLKNYYSCENWVSELLQLQDSAKQAIG